MRSTKAPHVKGGGQVTIPPSALRAATSLVQREVLARRVQHIFNENTVASCRIIHQHMGHSSDELAILNNRRAGHADVK